MLVNKLRQTELRKRPGVAEAIDWAAALLCLDIQTLKGQEEQIEKTLTCLLKTKEDHAKVNVNQLVKAVTS